MCNLSDQVKLLILVVVLLAIAQVAGVIGRRLRDKV